MANIDERVRRLELIFAALTGGSAVLVVVVLGFFGFATFHQIPHEVQQQMPMAVANEIESKYPNIEEELEERMEELMASEAEARTTADQLELLAATHDGRLGQLVATHDERLTQLAANHDERLGQLAETHDLRLESLESAIGVKRFHNYGYIDCGEVKTLRVPEGTTDEWVLFSASPHMSADTKRLTGNNALYSFGTTITSLPDGETWSVEFSVEINLSADTVESGRRTVQRCTSESWESRPTVQILAIRTA